MTGELDKFRKIHLIGIGGAGMSAIASVLIGRGFQVSGSDIVDTATTRNLARGGARICLGHRAENLDGVDMVVYSSAIGTENPEYCAAEGLGVPLRHRADVLADLMLWDKSVAVSGTHGKTTTTTMLGVSLLEAGADPTVIVGAEVPDFGGHALTGRGEWTIAEADESDGSFLKISPDRILVTNIEADHLDYYRDLGHVIETFGEFFGRLRPGGKVIGCIDSQPVAELLAKMKQVARITYGIENPEADMRAIDIRHEGRPSTVSFMPVLRGEPLDRVHLKLPGRHNVANALGVLATAMDIGISFDAVRQGLQKCKGARRRFEIKGTAGGVTVIDDYAHHPTEVRATLAAASARGSGGRTGRLIAVFQPHRYSRTVSLAREFGASFSDADMIIVTDIYGAGEAVIEGVSGLIIADSAHAAGHRDVRYIPSNREIERFLCSELREGDTLVTLGAGDVWRTAENVLEQMREAVAVASA